MKTCFVIIGYGEKTDYRTGKKFNLDRTYQHLIKPVFDKLEIVCFRAIDKKQEIGGQITHSLFHWLLGADIVIADLSTVNPNVFYELGIRHAFKPYSTIVMGEDGMEKPFDINQLYIEPYRHLGEDIGFGEVRRFQADLEKKVRNIIENKDIDSPVYQLLNKLSPPRFTEDELIEIRNTAREEEVLAHLVSGGEAAKKARDFNLAVQLFTKALDRDPGNVFLTQRLALVTYKNGSPSLMEALEKARMILQKLDPENTTDPETLGLMGAIHKRRYQLQNNRQDLEASLFYYNRGFCVKQDYYNGINVAFLYNLRALLQDRPDEAQVDFITAKRVRKRVAEICNHLIENAEEFKARGDRNWIFFTLAEAYLGLEQDEKVSSVLEQALNNSEGNFDRSSFQEQTKELKDLINHYKTKYT